MPVETIDRSRQELDAGSARVSGEVDHFFSELLASTGDGRERLYEAMRHAAVGGGKRLRPLLTIAAARLFAIDRVRALRVGCSIEAIHV
jgi:farnesyl diphosphate synthase